MFNNDLTIYLRRPRSTSPSASAIVFPFSFTRFSAISFCKEINTVCKIICKLYRDAVRSKVL